MSAYERCLCGLLKLLITLTISFLMVPEEMLVGQQAIPTNEPARSAFEWHTTAIMPGTNSAADPSAAPVVRVEVRFHCADAGEVIFIWGLEKWSVVPETRPPGTYVDRGTVMNTPMQRKGDTFTVEFEAPAYMRVDFGFLITRTASGQPVRIWRDNHGEDFTRTLSLVTVDQVITRNPQLPPRVYWLLGIGGIVSAFFAWRLIAHLSAGPAGAAPPPDR